MIEPGRTPEGAPFEHRLALFNSITAAMRDAEGQLEQDGLSPSLIVQIIANTLCHALANLAISLDMDREEIAEVFLRYCADLEAERDKIGARRLDS